MTIPAPHRPLAEPGCMPDGNMRAFLNPGGTQLELDLGSRNGRQRSAWKAGCGSNQLSTYSGSQGPQEEK
jgi:hypothetical protein